MMRGGMGIAAQESAEKVCKGGIMLDNEEARSMWVHKV